jgi:ADP-ribose pyrophosphatase YjhB (NUDIX family)
MASRRYPGYPIPSVGGVVVGAKGILLVRRDKDPGKGTWSLPGGAIEIGESQEEALIREIREETGIESRIVELVGTADVVLPDSEGMIEYHYVINHYLATAITDKTRPESPDAEVKWFRLGNLPKDNMNPRILDLLKRLAGRIVALSREIENSR